MKNLKKVLSVLLVVALLVATMVPAFAAETATISADSKICADIGMLVGDGAGVTADYTKTAPTRIQAAILLLRLKGLEADAAKFAGKENFADVKGDDWFAPYTAYLKANASVGFQGIEDGKFAAEEKITAQQYYKVVLTALGYECAEGKDYVYADTLKFAAEKGLKLVAGVTEYTINDLAIATVEALKTAVKGETKTLATKLVDDKKLDAAKAEAAGIYKPVVAASSMTATVAGKAKFNVVFNAAVDDTKATITVKKGANASNIKSFTWAEDKKSVVVEMASNLTKGDYDITVAGLTETALTAKVTAEDQKVAKIEFNNEIGVMSGTFTTENGFEYSDKITTTLKVLNQYNENATSTYYTSLTWSDPSKTSIASDGVVTITGKFKVNDVTPIVAIYSDASAGVYVTQSAVLKVSEKVQISSIEINSVYNADKKVITAGFDDNTFYLVVNFKDQYGSSITNKDTINSALSNVFSSNPSVLKVGKTFENKTIDGANKVVLPIGKPDPREDGKKVGGKSTVTIISNFGKMASYEVIVKESVNVDTLAVSTPEYVVVGEKVKLTFTAIDQFGNEVTSKSAIDSGMATALSASGKAKISFEPDYVNNKADLVLDLTEVKDSTSPVIITGMTGTNKFVQLNITPKAARKPVAISAIKDFTQNFAKDAKATFKTANVVVKDQYGRDITTLPSFDPNVTDPSIFGTGVDNYRIDVTSGSTSYVTVTDDTYLDNSKVSALTFNAIAKGSSSVTLKLKKGDGSVVANSEDYVFTSKVVEKADIASYELADIAKVFVTANTAYAKAITVNGVLADGTTKVVVPASYYTVTAKSEGVDAVTVTGKVYAPGVKFGENETEKTIPVTVTVNGANGASVLTKTFIATKVNPAPTTLTLVTKGVAKVEATDVISTSVATLNKVVNGVDTGIATLVIDAIKNVDQYGVENTLDTYDIVVTNLPSGKTIAGYNNDTTTNVVAGNTFNVTAITENGLSKTFKVVLK